MKRLLSLLITFVILLNVTACTGNKGNMTIVDAYKNAAQEFIDAGDIESAKKALEEGIATTQDETLKVMLEDLWFPDFSSYAGTWTKEETTAENPGLILSIFKDDNRIGLLFTSSITNESEFEVAYKEYALTELNQSTVQFKFEDESKRHSETFKLKFNDDSIECEISNVVTTNDVIAGFTEGKYILVKNDTLYNGYSYIMDEYIFTVESYAQAADVEPTPAPTQSQNFESTQGAEVTSSPKADSYYYEFFDTSLYPMPITCYTLSTGKVTTYYGDDLNSGTGYIDGYNDQCIIHQLIMHDGVPYAKVTYPGVKAYAYAPIYEFIPPISGEVHISIPQNQTVYRRSDLKESIGTAFQTDTILMVSESENAIQIIYPTGNGYKMGWIPSAAYTN